MELGHERVVAKRLDAPYLPGQRSRSWLKRKCPAWKRDPAPPASGAGLGVLTGQGVPEAVGEGGLWCVPSE